MVNGRCAASQFEFVVNCLQFLLGIAVVSLALFVIIGYSFLLVLVPVNTIYISLGVGLGLILVGCFGCYSAQDSKRGKRRALYCNVCLVTVCLAAQIASIYLFQTAALTVTRQNEVPSGSLTNVDEIYYNNAILSSYTECCTGEFNSTRVNPHCLQGEQVVCSFASVCLNVTDDGCFNTVVNNNVRVDIAPQVCRLFETTSWNGAYLVGSVSATNSSCGNGHPQVFASNMLSFFGWAYGLAVVGLAVLCALQAINLVAGICVMENTAGGWLAKKPPPTGGDVSFQATNRF